MLLQRPAMPSMPPSKESYRRPLVGSGFKAPVVRHAAADLLVKVGNCARAGFQDPTAHHNPVRVEAMHQDVASRPALKVGAKVLGIVAFFSDPGASEVGEVLAFRNPNATPFEDNAV